MDKIIARVDGSIYAASVCEHAAWIAQRSGAPVELIHVLGRREAPEKPDLSGALALGARSALMAELADLDAQRAKLIAHRGRAILDDARDLVAKAGVTQVSTRLRHGDLLETVAEVEGQARVILIGKRGEAADFAKGHLGSNLERIVRATTRPVLVASRAFRPIGRVLVAYDGGPSAMRAVDHIARSTVFQGLAIHLVSVGADTPGLRKGLQDAAAMLRAAGLQAETSIVPGQPDTALAEMVEALRFDMLVMGAYGHARIRSLIIGSTTSAMVRQCKVPVVMIR